MSIYSRALLSENGSIDCLHSMRIITAQDRGPVHSIIMLHVLICYIIIYVYILSSFNNSIFKV